MRQKDLAISLVINVVGGIATFLVLKDPIIATLVVFALFLSTVIVLLFLRIGKINKTVIAIEKTSSQSLQCCGLHATGFSQVFHDAKDTRRMTFDLANNSFRFLGVTGEFVAGSEAKEFRTLMKQKAKLQGCRFQIILLDPEANEVVERHAMQDSSSKEAISLEIKETIEQLKSISKECGSNLEVWLHRELPVFRLIVIDDERVFVSFYGAIGAKGIETPQLVFHKSDCSFFVPFLNTYEEVLRNSKRLL